MNYSVEEATLEAVCTTQGCFHEESRINRVTSGASIIKTNKICSESTAIINILIISVRGPTLDVRI